MLLWLDLETTGLLPTQEHVLEVAAVVTTDELEEVARFVRVVYSPRAAAVLELLGKAKFEDHSDDFWLRTTRVDPYVVKMHLNNGLWTDVRHGQALATVDQDLAAFVREHGVYTRVVTNEAGEVTETKTYPPQLAGSTVSFDRAFLAEHLPLAHATLHYRNVDVTTLNELARRFWPKTHDARPRAPKVAHRGLADILESIATARYYVGALGPVDVPAVVTVGAAKEAA